MAVLCTAACPIHLNESKWDELQNLAQGPIQICCCVCVNNEVDTFLLISSIGWVPGVQTTINLIQLQSNTMFEFIKGIFGIFYLWTTLTYYFNASILNLLLKLVYLFLSKINDNLMTTFFYY